MFVGLWGREGYGNVGFWDLGGCEFWGEWFYGDVGLLDSGSMGMLAFGI